MKIVITSLRGASMMSSLLCGYLANVTGERIRDCEVFHDSMHSICGQMEAPQQQLLTVGGPVRDDDAVDTLVTALK